MPPKKTTTKSTSSSSPRRSTRKQKSSTSSSTTTSQSKKSKPQPSKSKSTHGSKHDTTDAPARHNASPTNLPSTNQNVTWKAMPGWVQGHVVEILTSAKTVEGKSVKASKEDPRIVLKSHGPSGKIAVHKPAAVWFD
ncbi:Hva1_TUDOR domain-containing protein [Pseudozyma hubeiensis]|nr:Hva1_TUDOR domain-containing protein [Pseudozyma hubeiensis]